MPNSEIVKKITNSTCLLFYPRLGSSRQLNGLDPSVYGNAH
jgi:hypothetical protein